MRAVSTSAVIAKYLGAVALHGRAAESPLHPVLALRALLVLGSTHEADEGSLLLVKVHQLSILVAAHVLVGGAFAAETVCLVAGEAAKLADASIVLENNWTVRSWTPARRLPVLLDVLGEDEIKVFLLQLSGQDRAYYLPLDAQVAVLLRAFHHFLAILDLHSHVLAQAIAVEGVPTLELVAGVRFELLLADGALGVPLVEGEIIVYMRVARVGIGLVGLVLVGLGASSKLNDKLS